MNDTALTLVGCGNMGRSLAGGLVRAGWSACAITGIDPDPEQCRLAAEQAGIRIGTDGQQAIGDSVAVILAVKPQKMQATLAGMAPALARSQPLLISVAAGIPCASIRRWAGCPVPVVRSMPNTPALIGASATGAWASHDVSLVQRQLAERVLSSVGIVHWLESESQLDLVTALSGSGPAYFFLLMEALMDAAVERGLDRTQARQLTLQTALGAARMAMEGGLEPGQLRRNVTSPGGTTERALAVLEQGRFRELMADAVEAARRRAAELAQELGAG